MEILGWLFVVLLSLYGTFALLAGNYVSFGFSGKVIGLIENILSMSVVAALWYAVFAYAPFTLIVN